MRTVLDNIYIAVTGAKTYLSEWRRWRTKPQGGSPKVYYGMEHVPKKDAFTSGGLVKVQDLSEKFPNCTSGANLLYLVSSCYPFVVESTTAMAKDKGVKLVINQNGVAYQAWFGSGWKQANIKLSNMLMKADYIIYQSRFCKTMSDEFLGSSSANSEILYNPVDTDYFVPANPQDSSDRIRLLLSGSHGQIYRIESAVRTLACLIADGVDAVLAIAGRFYWDRNETKCFKQVEALCQDLNVKDKVEWVGGYNQQQAAGLFQKADILLHPTYNDVCPRLIVESMACGVPVVYSASGGAPELVGSDAGIGVAVSEDWAKIHVPKEDAMADAVKRVWADIKAYSSAARKRAVSKFDVRPWVERHGYIFKKLTCV